MKENFIRSYRVGRNNKIALVSMGGFFFAGGIFLMFFPFLEHILGDLGRVFFIMTFGLAMLLASLYVILLVFSYRFEILADRIRSIGVFGTKELMFDEIDGFRIAPSNFILFFSEKTKKTIKVLFVFDGQQELREWAREKFNDMEAEDKRNEMADILDNENLGDNETQRKETLKRARAWSKVLTILSLAVGFWGLLYPRPYHLVLWCLILLPIFMFFSMLWFRGAIRFNVNKNSAFVSADLALIAPWFLAMRALLDWFRLFDWNLFWAPFALVTLFMLGLLLFCSKDSPRRGSSIFLGLFFCCVYSFGVVLSVNGMMDKSVPAVYESKMIDKRLNRGRHNTSYYMTLSPWGPVSEQREFRVDKSSYGRHLMGDKVNVYLYGGALKIPWYNVY